ncbi:MAG: DUF748 domain-containing protein, partial [Magnetococcales bacterium]|nr:DUF748 domain-containing protein [Magnetococcales bacterium]
SVERTGSTVSRLSTTTRQRTPARNSTESSKALAIRIGRIQVTGKSVVHFLDQAALPPFNTALHITSARINSLDSRNPESPSTLVFHGSFDKYSKLAISGSVKPFLESPSLALETSLDAVELPQFSSYTTPLMGYELKSGTLNGDLATTIENNTITGTNHLIIAQLEVEGVDKEKMGGMEAKLSMPLGLALDMIRDGNGDITLKIPVSGSLDDPQFNVSDVINTAVAKAMKVAAISVLKASLQPFGALLTVAELASDAISRVRFQPVPFAVGSAVVDEQGEAYMGKMAGVLSDKKSLRIKLCGFAVEKDREVLLTKAVDAWEKEQERVRALATRKEAELKQNKGHGEETPSKKETEHSVAETLLEESVQETAAIARPEAIDDEKLLALAKARSVALKDLLVTGHSVEPSRLFICREALDENPKAEPRVEPSM